MFIKLVYSTIHSKTGGSAMKKALIICLLFVFTTSVFAEVGFEGRPITNNLWMPTGYTLNSGEFLVGLGPIGFGISDNIQIGTNILLFLFQVYNANLKISLIKTDDLALAGGVGFHHFNWNLEGEDFNPTAITPYAVVTFGMGPKTNLHVGGEYYLFTEDFDIEDIDVESSVSGSRIFAGLEQSLSEKTKFLFEGGYDIDFEGLMLGGAVLFGWEKFRLKLGVSYFNPKEAESGFALPVIGLWWRFKG